MPVASTDIVERIARVLAARRFSSNAEGEDASAAAEVDAGWRDHRADALAVLHTLREPDPAMADAGDVDIWQKMVEAALGEAVASQA